MSLSNTLSFDHQVRRFTANLNNNSEFDTLAESIQSSPVPFLSDASMYTAVVESSTLDLSGMVLNTKPNYKVLIMNHDKTGKYPNLPLPDNIFTLNDPIMDATDLTLWLYNTLHKKALPADLGDFDINDAGYFTFSLPDDTAFRSGDIDVYFNMSLYNLLGEFCSQETARIGQEYFYKMLDNKGHRVQKRYTLSRLLDAVSIYIGTDLPVTEQRITNTQLGTSTSERILTFFTLNRETFDVVNKYSLVYNPSTSRHVTMNSHTEIQDFKIYVKIHYRNGSYVIHTMKPGDYSIVNIAFHPRPELLLQ